MLLIRLYKQRVNIFYINKVGGSLLTDLKKGRVIFKYKSISNG